MLIALLCGLNGYTIFLEENWIGEIVSWQNRSTGCYEYYDVVADEHQHEDHQRQRRRCRKRNVLQLDDKCSDHMSGLAVAALGLFANVVQFA